MLKVVNAKTYFKIIESFDNIPFTQSYAWFSFLKSTNTEIILYVDDLNDTKIAFFGKEKKVPLIGGKILLIETFLLKDNVTEKTIRKKLNGILDLGYIGVELDSITKYSAEIEVGLRRAGFVRPLGFTRCPLTLYVDLQKPINYDSNWKRNVKKAISGNIKVEEIIEPIFSDAELFCSLFSQTAELKDLNYRLQPVAIHNLLKHVEIRLFNAILNNEVVSSQIIYIKNGICYSIFRANGFKSRNNGSSYLLYSKIFELLNRENHRTYDFGRIPPSNHATDSVYTFKNASRAKKIQYIGEWVLYKNSTIEGLMYLYKRFVLKKQRY